MIAAQLLTYDQALLSKTDTITPISLVPDDIFDEDLIKLLKYVDIYRMLVTFYEVLFDFCKKRIVNG